LIVYGGSDFDTLNCPTSYPVFILRGALGQLLSSQSLLKVLGLYLMAVKRSNACPYEFQESLSCRNKRTEFV
jgi:hypothetical protein